MNALIIKFFSGIIATMIGHKIISILFSIIFGFVVYCMFFNKDLLNTTYENIKTFFPSLKEYALSYIKK